MNITRGAAGLLGLAMLLCTGSLAIAQSQPEVRRARPVDESPVPRAIPIGPADRSTRSLIDEFSEPPAREAEGADQRQLEYANGLFARKLYDLAIPEYQKYLDDYPGRAGRANMYFSLGECYRNLHRDSSARTNLQKVLNDYGDSEFAGPAAFALAEMAFADKDYPRRCRFFIVLPGSRRNRRLRLRRDISRRAALRLSAVRMKRQIFTPKLRKQEAQTHTARMRE